MTDFTVAICTYNGENRLPAVLARLRSQTGIESMTWEVIVVDNNSNDNTAQIVQTHQADWPAAYPLKYYFEPQQGVAFARRRAIKEAQGIWIGFLDDDNLPTSTWIAAAYSFGQAYPKAGAYGSRLFGQFEVPPPQNFERISRYLAVMEGGKTPFLYNSHKGLLPTGAGLVICKQAWMKNVPDTPTLLGRVGNSLAAKGEEIEALWYIKRAGWEIWHNPEMCIHHYIPKWRLEEEYLIKLFQGVGLGRHHTRMLRFKAWEKPFAFFVYFVNDLRKIIQHYLRYWQVLQTDIVAACEMQLFLFSFLSPFYLLKQNLIHKWKH